MEQLLQVDVESAAAGIAGASLATTALLHRNHQRSDESDEERRAEPWWEQVVAAHKYKVLAVFALMPIIDLVSDLGSFNSLMNTAHYAEACVIMAILFLNWRFVTLYSALTPEPTFASVNLLYCPLAFHLGFDSIMGVRTGDADVRAQLYAEAVEARRRAGAPSGPTHSEPSPRMAAAPERPPQLARQSSRSQRAWEASQQADTLTRSLYGPEPAWMRTWLLAEHDKYLQLPGPLSRLYFVLCAELKLLAISFFLGVKLLWSASVQLALETIDPDAYGSRELGAEADKHKLYLRVLTVVEAFYESLLQLIVQTYIFVHEPGSINPYVFGFSATCSVVGISVAIYHFVRNREQIMKVLRPPVDALKAQAVAMANAGAEVDAPTILSAVLKAREVGVDMSVLLPTVDRLLNERAFELQGKLSEASEAGGTRASAARALKGFVAAEFRSAGLSLEEAMNATGCSLAQSRAAGYSATDAGGVGYTYVEVRSAGFSLSEALGAGYAMEGTSTDDVEIVAAPEAAALVALLGGDSPGSRQEGAALALRFLARNDANRQAIAAAGGLAPLIALLSSGTPEAQERTAGALEILASNAKIKKDLLALGCPTRVWE